VFSKISIDQPALLDGNDWSYGGSGLAWKERGTLFVEVILSLRKERRGW